MGKLKRDHMSPLSDLLDYELILGKQQNGCPLRVMSVHHKVFKEARNPGGWIFLQLLRREEK